MRSLKWVVLPLAAALLAALMAHSAVESFLLNQAERNIRDVLLSHRGVHLYIQRTMHPEFYRARANDEIPRNYYAPELLSSSFMVRVLHGYYNEERQKAGLPQLYYKMAADNPRNPVNAADASELRLLRYFRTHPAVKEYRAVEDIGGTTYLVFAMPFLRTGSACLKCHGTWEEAPEGLRARYGKKGGFGDTVGNLRAIESLRVPLGREKLVTWVSTLAILAALGAIAVLFGFNQLLSGAVSERTRALASSEERWKFALEGAGDGVWDWSIPDNTVFFSSAWKTMLGYGEDEVGSNVGGWESRVHPDDQERRRENLDRHVCGEGPVYSSEHRMRCADGTYRWVLDRGKIVERAPDGSPRRMIGTQRDITERRRAEEELRESEEKFRTIFDGANDGNLVVDPETGRILEANRTICEMLGYSRGELLGTDVKELHPVEERARILKEFKEHIRGERTVSPELPIRRKDASIFFAELRSTPVMLRGRRYLEGIFRDVTERRKAAAEAQRLEAQLLQAQKMESVGRLAGGVAHDFNNMLTAIIGHAELALLRVEPESSLRADLTEILAAAGRSSDLTRQLLAFARKQTVSPKVLDLNDAVAGMLKMLRRLVGEDIDLVWVPGHEVSRIRIDPSQLDQVLANLAVNARDAIAGTGTLTLETKDVVLDETKWPGQQDFAPGSYVLLSVTDTGCGMPKDVLEHVFEPFFTTKGPGKGTGLGLSTVFGIARQNGGHVTAYSEEGKGTTLRVYLPRCEDGATASPQGEARTIRGGPETILLVEDDGAILRVAQRMLEGAGYTILAAPSPVEGLRLARDHFGEIHLLLTDVVMPEMNGRELAERIREIRPTIRCLYMSGYTANVIAHRGVLDEGVHFISKPLGRDDLLRAVRVLLDEDGTPGTGRGPA